MRYLLRRLGFFVLTLWAALTLNFFIPRLMPGSPCRRCGDRLTTGSSPGRAAADARPRSGSSRTRTSSVQYIEYLKNMVTGHWGVSIGGHPGRAGDHAWSGRRCRGRSASSASTTILAFLLGIADRDRRRLAARRRDRLAWLPPVFVVTSALPYFWVALLLILVFSVWTDAALPSDFNYDSGLQPALTPAVRRAACSQHAHPAGGDDPDHRRSAAGS